MNPLGPLDSSAGVWFNVLVHPGDSVLRPLSNSLQKHLCHGAPFYVLGPLVTDIAPGYDHITSAIGGTIAAAAGADFLCYVTPSEHRRLSTVEDVREGVMACRIAAHAADIVKGVKGAIEKDNQMARCRKKLDWEGQFALAIDPREGEAGCEPSPAWPTMVPAPCAASSAPTK